MKNLLIVGAGGHGKVIADCAAQMDCWQKVAFIDQRYPTLKTVMDVPVIGDDKQMATLHNEYHDIVIAIGDNQRRYQLGQQAEQLGFALATIIHLSAEVSPHAQIGKGTVIFANAIVNAEAQIGDAVIINSGAVVEHDCRVGNGTHISPNATLAGNVTVGAFSWIGMGATVIQGTTIGNYTVCGAGAVVITDVADEKKVVGVPAATKEIMR